MLSVYFCVLGALQNVAKYEEASRARVRLHATDELCFDIQNDDRGFNTSKLAGTRLPGRAKRLDAIGRRLKVRSTPGSGTGVTGLIPVAGK